MIDYFTFTSLLLTPITLFVGFLVISHWGKSSFIGMRANDTAPRDWLILGIVIGFAGGFIDNVYWGIAWHLSYTGHPSSQWWFDHGSVCNVFARQGAGILSGFCHIFSAYMSVKSPAKSKVKAVMMACVGLGLIYAVVLLRGWL